MSTTALPLDLQLFVRQGFEFAWERDGVSSIYHLEFAPDGSPEKSVAFELAHPDGRRLGRVLPHLDGRKTLPEVARAAGVSVEEAVLIADPLYAAGVLTERTADVSVPAVLFYENARRAGFAWLRRKPAAYTHFLHPESVERDPEAARRVVLGFLIEEWHFVRRNQTFVIGAIGSAVSEAHRLMWSRLFADEYIHGTWLEEGLQTVISRSDLFMLQPMPESLAVLHHLRWVAEEDELNLALCLALGESGASNPEAEGRDLAAMHRYMHGLGLLPDELFEPFFRHDATDEEADHLAVTRQPFEDTPALPFQRRDRLLRAVWNYTEALHRLWEGIARHYASSPDLYFLPDDLPPRSVKAPERVDPAVHDEPALARG